MIAKIPTQAIMSICLSSFDLGSVKVRVWSAMPGSNRRHSGWKPDTLPTELMALTILLLQDHIFQGFLLDNPWDYI